MNFCNECNKETNYEILASHKYEPSDDEYRCMYQWLIVQCKGCNTVAYRSEFHDIEAGYPVYDPYSGEEWTVPVSIENFPKARKYKLIEDDEFIPEAIYKTYIQTLAAYQEEATILAGIGFRAIIEAICSDQSANEGNLEKSINKLNQNGILSKQESNLLHSIRFLGNDAAHEIKEPTSGQLKTTLKIIEHLLFSLYILPNSVKKEMETVIETYDEFESLVSSSALKLTSGDELLLLEILGRKVMRRFVDNLPRLQSELNKRISEGNYANLKLGKIEQRKNRNVQYYVIP